MYVGLNLKKNLSLVSGVPPTSFLGLHPPLVPERIRFRLCVLAQRCLNGTAQPYLADGIRRVADVDGRRHLRSTALVVPPVCRSTPNDRAFPVAAPRTWNSLPSAVKRGEHRLTHFITLNGLYVLMCRIHGIKKRK